MPVQNSEKRVVLLNTMRGEVQTDIGRSIVEYGAQTEDWQFVGIGTTSFVQESRLGEVDADGVIGTFLDWQNAIAAAENGMAVVMINYDATDVGLPLVCTDNQAAGRMGAEHLLGHGFANLAYFSDTSVEGSGRRLESFRDTVESTGRECHVLLIEGESPSEIREAAADCLASLPKPIGIMAYNDYYGRLTIDEALRLGLRVPDDVAVLGMNNNPWMTIMPKVPLSSIGLDKHRIGYLAAETLDAVMNGENPPTPRLVPPLGVVSRRSTDVVRVDDPIVSRAMAYIRDHLSEGIIVEEVLMELGISRRNLEQRMKRAIGKTPRAAINDARIEQAKGLLVATDKPMYQIADMCGFEQPSQFFVVFKRLVGMTPGQFRQQRTRP